MKVYMLNRDRPNAREPPWRRLLWKRLDSAVAQSFDSRRRHSMSLFADEYSYLRLTEKQSNEPLRPGPASAELVLVPLSRAPRLLIIQLFSLSPGKSPSDMRPTAKIFGFARSLYLFTMNRTRRPIRSKAIVQVVIALLGLFSLLNLFAKYRA